MSTPINDDPKAPFEDITVYYINETSCPQLFQATVNIKKNQCDTATTCSIENSATT